MAKFLLISEATEVGRDRRTTEVMEIEAKNMDDAVAKARADQARRSSHEIWGRRYPKKVVQVAEERDL